MAQRLNARSGIAVRAGTDTKLGLDDLNQLVDALLAAKRVLFALLGGEAVYAGGAADLSGLGGGGTTYPPVTLMVQDHDGEAWPFTTSSYTALTFKVTATDSGGKPLTATTYTTGTVTAVDTQNGTNTLSLGDISVPLSNLHQIYTPGTNPGV